LCHYDTPATSLLSTHDTTTAISTLSLHDALPISDTRGGAGDDARVAVAVRHDCQGASRQNAAPAAMSTAPTPHHSRRVRRPRTRSEEHTSELQSRFDLVCRLLLEKKKKE